jgi:hypothetical protein
MKFLLLLSCLLSASKAAESAQQIEIGNEDILANVWQLPIGKPVTNLHGAQLLYVSRLKALQAVNAGTFYGLVNVDKIIVPAILTRYHEAFAINKHSGNKEGYQILLQSFNKFIQEIKKSKREKINATYPESFARAIKYAKTPYNTSSLPQDLRTDLESIDPKTHFTKKSLQQAKDLFNLLKTDLKVD